MKIIGITGGVACGKSTVTTHIRSQGFTVIDADEIVTSLYKKKAIQTQINNHFQTTDKKKIREIVFSNPAAKEILEDLLHPLVQQEIEKEIRQHQKRQTPILFFSIPLLFETGMESMFDSTLAIICDAKKQRERLMERDAISSEEAQKIIYAQIPNEKKAKLADKTVLNNGTQKSLLKKIDTFLQKL